MRPDTERKKGRNGSNWNILSELSTERASVQKQLPWFRERNWSSQLDIQG